MLSLLQGDCVEVAFTDRDYEHSWALAVVQRATNGNHTCSISYNDFYMDEGGVVNVVEDVEVSRLRRASTVGLRDVALQDYRAGDSVELWDDVRSPLAQSNTPLPSQSWSEVSRSLPGYSWAKPQRPARTMSRVILLQRCDLQLYLCILLNTLTSEKD